MSLFGHLLELLQWSFSPAMQAIEATSFSAIAY